MPAADTQSIRDMKSSLTKRGLGEVICFHPIFGVKVR
jgi:hypothetical protein